jgi:adenylylsulfate kinase-like enzyme
MIIWITGFSGAGKTTIAKLLQQQMNIHQLNPILLDGDEVRLALDISHDYSAEERKKMAFRYARLGKLLSDQDLYVIISTISMFEDVRQWNRLNNTRYLEIYLKVSAEERKERDPKKLYASNARMVGIEQCYQEPQNPDIIFDSKDKHLPEEISQKIMTQILTKKRTQWNMEILQV